MRLSAAFAGGLKASYSAKASNVRFPPIAEVPVVVVSQFEFFRLELSRPAAASDKLGASMEVAMAFKVRWKFAGGEESRAFESLSFARDEADARLLAYTEAHGSTVVTIHNVMGERVYIEGQGHA